MSASRNTSRMLSLVLLLAACTPVCYFPKSFITGAARVPTKRSLVLVRAVNPDTMAKIAEVVAEQLGVDKEKVVGTATLSELGADSLDIVETVMALEEAFDVELPDEETTKLKNVGDVADLIQSKI
mmetsp:Transcript_3971/g.8066  ORF Transcript_3971/g.8066 Transcript_3971/m.8066 type:complete len:126 (-) Transcript_3971:82-459(-)